MTKRCLNVLWLVDQPLRDYAFAENVQNVAPNHKVSVTIRGPSENYVRENRYSFVDDYLKSGKYDCIVVPNLTIKSQPGICAAAIFHDARLIVYHSEQVYSPIFNRHKLSLKRSGLYERLVDAHFVWSKYYEEKILYFYPNANIFQVGNFKLDQRTLRRSAEPRTILFANNFRFADADDATWREWCRKCDLDPQTLLHRYQHRVRAWLLDELERLINQLPDYKFIVRPHPGESLAPYERFLVYDNVRSIDYERPFAQDLARAEIFVTHTSTSIYEAIQAGLPCYQLGSPELIDERLMQPPIEAHRFERADIMAAQIREGIWQQNFYFEALERVMGTDHEAVTDRILRSLHTVGNWKTKRTARDKLRFVPFIVTAVAKNWVIRAYYRLYRATHGRAFRRFVRTAQGSNRLRLFRSLTTGRRS